MTGDEKRRWEVTADGWSDGPGRDPASIVRNVVTDCSPGRALDIATGQGRNAIFLAERGWTVDAVDISRAMLDPARARAAARSVAVNWILADIDGYCFPEETYDLVTISYFDARHRLDAVIEALAPGGVLCYEHHLVTNGAHSGGPGDRYRFEPGELRAACSALEIERYAEDHDERRVEMIARKPVA